MDCWSRWTSNAQLVHQQLGQRQVELQELGDVGGGLVALGVDDVRWPRPAAHERPRRQCWFLTAQSLLAVDEHAAFDDEADIVRPTSRALDRCGAARQPRLQAL